MRKIKLLTPVALTLSTVSPLMTSTLTSCKSDKSIIEKLKSMPNVTKVEQMDDLPSYNARYMIYFEHPIDWTNEDKGTFIQRVEFDYRGLDRVNQLFTCGYELRNEKPDRMNDYEIATHFQGNIIKPEYRFFDKSRPEGLSNDGVAGWEYLNNTQAVEDFHSIIESFKTILTGKWAFTGTSKGGETTNAFAMVHPNDCQVYVPYVAPKFYAPQGEDSKVFQTNIYNTIGDNVLGENVAKEYRDAVAYFQYYALNHRNDLINNKSLIEYFWAPYAQNKFTTWTQKHHELVFDICLQECATSFWQYNQNISTLKDFRAMAESTEEEKLAKNIKCVEIMQDLNDPTGWQTDSLFFPYYYQAKTEMGEYCYDFEEMKKSLVTHGYGTEEDIEAMLGKDETESTRKNIFWKMIFNDVQYATWINKFDSSFAAKMVEWNNSNPTCHIFRIYGGADTWTALKLEDKPSDTVKIYYGNDATNARGRTHYTRISNLSASVQKEIWPQIENLLK